MLFEPITWSLIALFFFRNSPGVMAMIAGALIAWIAWRRTRFFGNTAPLIAGVAILLLGMLLPHAGGFSMLVVALPFFFVFAAGVATDLLETRYSGLVLGVVAGILASHAIFSLTGLSRTFFFPR